MRSSHSNWTNKRGQSKSTVRPIQKISGDNEQILPKQPITKNKLLIGLILVVCAVVTAVHSPVLSTQALSIDDGAYLTNNILVQNPSWRSAKRFLTEVLDPSTVGGYYQPLTMISLMVDYALGGRPDNLRQFHRTSLALHVSNTSLVIILLYLLFGQTWIAVGVGLLFGLHPMAVEPIPWVGERKTLLAAFFSLWCLIIYIQYTRKNSKQLQLGCLLMYILALMSKPTSTPLPVLMLLLDYWPLKRWKRPVIIEKLPLFIVGGISVIITVISQSKTAISTPGDFGVLKVPLTICHNIVFYLYKIILPINLSSHYPFPEPMSLSHPMVLAGVVGTLMLVAALWISLRWTQAALTGWLFFFIAILPTMQILRFSDVIAADKFAYLPSIGLLIILTSFLGWFCGTRKLVVRRIAVVLIVLILASAEAMATRRYLVHWQNTTSLVEYMLKLTPNETSLHNMLGMELELQGNSEESISHLQRALEIKPNNARAHNNLANALKSQGKLDEAIIYYRKAIKITPDDAKLYSNLGNIFFDQGKLDKAINQHHKAIEVDPEYVGAYFNLANALKKQNKLHRAISYYQQALKINPNHASSHCNLGQALSLIGRQEEAIKHFDRALKIKPNDVDSYCGLGTAWFRRGKFDKAIHYYRQALKIQPDNAIAHYNIGAALSSQGKTDEAIKHLNKAMQLNPNDVDSHVNLGNIFVGVKKLDKAIEHFSKAVDLQPDDAARHNDLGNVLAMTGKLDDAIEHYRISLEVRPGNAHTLNNLANAFLETGKLKEAEDKYRESLRIDSNNVGIHFHLAVCIERQGRIDEAIEKYKKVLNLNPEHKRASEALKRLAVDEYHLTK